MVGALAYLPRAHVALAVAAASIAQGQQASCRMGREPGAPHTPKAYRQQAADLLKTRQRGRRPFGGRAKTNPRSGGWDLGSKLTHCTPAFPGGGDTGASE